MKRTGYLFIFILLSIFFVSGAVYADNLHIQNRSVIDTVVAKVYLDGCKMPDQMITLKPGEEYIQDFWHNLSVNVDMKDVATKQFCEFEVEEKGYYEDEWGRWFYEPEVSLGNTCSHWGTFNQLNWVTNKGHEQNFSTINIWGPWS